MEGGTCAGRGRDFESSEYYKRAGRAAAHWTKQLGEVPVQLHIDAAEGLLTERGAGEQAENDPMGT